MQSQDALQGRAPRRAPADPRLPIVGDRARCWRPLCRVVAMASALLTLASLAEAGASLVEPRGTGREAGGRIEAGPYLAFPVPARDVGGSQLGVDAGASLSTLSSEGMGVGIDFAYHYWPASSGYRAAFDRYLRSNRLESLDGSEWACSVFQLTGHLRYELSLPGAGRPWLQVGAGAYRVDYNLDERRPAGTYSWVVGRGLGNSRLVGGGYVGSGLDMRVSPGVSLGLDATYHYLWMRHQGWGPNDLPDFSVVTIGTHVLFGRE